MFRSLRGLRTLVCFGCGVGAAAVTVYVLLVPDTYTSTEQWLVAGLLVATAIAAVWRGAAMVRTDG